MSSDSVLNSLLESSGYEEEGNRSRRGSVLWATRISPTADIAVGRNVQQSIVAVNESPVASSARTSLLVRHAAAKSKINKLNLVQTYNIAGR